MRILKSNPVLTLLNSYLVDSPQPSTLSYLWNFGSLLGLCLIAQIITGVLIAMHVSPTAETAFQSIEHIMRDVNEGWLLRYCHANMASFFFIAVYLHIARGLYYGSYRTPRIGVWVIGTVIFFLMMATAFLGYVIPFGQMSLWGVVLKSQLNLNKNYSILISEPIPSKEFMGLFIGFMDGDGYFDIGEQKQYKKKTKELVNSTIRIRLGSNVHKRDLPLFLYFYEKLGVGKISKMSGDREQVRIIFSKKDLVNVIIPLMIKYNLSFLTNQRIKQYRKVNYILNNSIVRWKDLVYSSEMEYNNKSVTDLINLDYFSSWLVGFTIAEGSFGFKREGSAFYNLKQKGEENLNLLKAACFVITGKNDFSFNPDSSNSYQLALRSKFDIQKVVNFFSISNPFLLGYKLKQYQIWLLNLKNSKRYKETIIPNE
jgi:Cytochrome b/b6/petB/LAGLIDADG endonuclease